MQGFPGREGGGAARQRRVPEFFQPAPGRQVGQHAGQIMAVLDPERQAHPLVERVVAEPAPGVLITQLADHVLALGVGHPHAAGGAPAGAGRFRAVRRRRAAWIRIHDPEYQRVASWAQLSPAATNN